MKWVYQSKACLKIKSSRALRYATYILITWTFLISGCTGKKHLSEETPAPEPKPGWVLNRPVSGTNYIGIGIATKVSESVDYAQIAKKNALNDLASEIKVNVSGETFFNTLEINDNFREEFISNITTTTSEDLEGYEMYGTWENDNEYWVYYRLSKVTYASIKKQKKDQALQSAADNFIKGTDARDQGNVGSALDLHFRGLVELKDYWLENNKFLLDGKEVLLDNEIYASMIELASNIRIEPELTSIVLSHENNYKQDLGVLVHYNGNPLRNMKLEYSYDKGRFVRPKRLITNELGTALVRVHDVNTENKENSLLLGIDLESMISTEYDSKLTKALVEKLKPETKEIPISIVFPKCFLTFEENNFGEPMSAPQISSSIKRELTKRGFTFTSSADMADFLIDVESNTVKGGTSNGFHVAYLQMSVNVKNSRSNEEVYQQTITKLKGLHLDFGSAGLEAYKNGMKRVENEIAKDLLNSLL
jgi:hypothetical protein